MRLKRVLRVGSANQLRAFSEPVWLSRRAASRPAGLADKLIAADQLLEAELLAGELLRSADPADAGRSARRLAALYEKAKRPELAARYYQRARGRNLPTWSAATA